MPTNLELDLRSGTRRARREPFAMTFASVTVVSAAVLLVLALAAESRMAPAQREALFESSYVFP